MRPDDSQEALRGLLETATKLVADLSDDPIFRRLLTVFSRMPAEDREPILAILEREVDGRLLCEASAAMTGVRSRPHPGARLYAGVIEPESPPVREEAILAAVRAMRVFRRDVAPAAAVWEAQMLQALRALDLDEIESIGRFNRFLHELIERVKGERPAST